MARKGCWDAKSYKKKLVCLDQTMLGTISKSLMLKHLKAKLIKLVDPFQTSWSLGIYILSQKSLGKTSISESTRQVRHKKKSQPSPALLCLGRRRLGPSQQWLSAKKTWEPKSCATDGRRPLVFWGLGSAYKTVRRVLDPCNKLGKKQSSKKNLLDVAKIVRLGTSSVLPYYNQCPWNYDILVLKHQVFSSSKQEDQQQADASMAHRLEADPSIQASLPDFHSYPDWHSSRSNSNLMTSPQPGHGEELFCWPINKIS